MGCGQPERQEDAALVDREKVPERGHRTRKAFKTVGHRSDSPEKVWKK